MLVTTALLQTVLTVRYRGVVDGVTAVSERTVSNVRLEKVTGGFRGHWISVIAEAGEVSLYCSSVLFLSVSTFMP